MPGDMTTLDIILIVWFAVSFPLAVLLIPDYEAGEPNCKLEVVGAFTP